MANEEQKRISDEEIRKYLESLSVQKNNALEFISQDSTTQSPAFDYVRRLIISQLEVRKHVEGLYGTVGAYGKDQKSPILESILANDDTYVRRLQSAEQSEPFSPTLGKDLGNIVMAKNGFITESFFILPSKIRNVQKLLDQTPESDIEKRKQLEEKLESLKAELQENENNMKTLYGPYNPAEQAEWAHVLDSTKGKLHQHVERSFASGAITPTQNIEELRFPINDRVTGFLIGKSREKGNINNLRADVATNANILKSIYEHRGEDRTLLEVIGSIRSQFPEKGISERPISSAYKTVETDGDHEFLKNTALPAEVPQKMEELSRRYEEAKKIQDPDEYMKAAAEIMEDLLVIHPYADGNGRTSRYLYSSMLVDRGITPPILYDVYNDRETFDAAVRSDIIDRQSSPASYDSQIVKRTKECSGKLPESRPRETKKDYQPFDLDGYIDSVTLGEVESELEQPQHQIGEEELKRNYAQTKPENRRTIFDRIKAKVQSLLQRRNPKMEIDQEQDTEDPRQLHSAEDPRQH